MHREVGLLHDIIAMIFRLVGIAKAQKVECQHPVTRSEVGPYRQPVEAGGRKAVQQEQRRRAVIAAGADEYPVAVPLDKLSVLPPLRRALGGDLHEDVLQDLSGSRAGRETLSPGLWGVNLLLRFRLPLAVIVADVRAFAHAAVAKNGRAAALACAPSASDIRQ